MNLKQNQVLQVLSRVAEFGAQVVDLFPKETVAAEAFAAIAGGSSKLSRHRTVQDHCRQALPARTASRSAARETLKEQVNRISQTAAVLAIDKPAVQDKFRQRSRDDQAMIHSALAFAKAAKQLKKEFLQHGMSNDFIEVLHTAARNLERAIQEQTSVKTAHTRVAKAIDKTITDCTAHLRRLDIIAANALADKPPALEKWNAVRQV